MYNFIIYIQQIKKFKNSVVMIQTCLQPISTLAGFSVGVDIVYKLKLACNEIKLLPFSA